MNFVNMHVLNGLWAGNDELGMSMLKKHDWWLVVYGHEIDMHDEPMVGW